ncbi:hypothetical protein BCR42DRAFT_403984 [Absidia repens]|uniref:N-acetyltransferase domain-containing protein n=1 Tax=Absidia repens TaxID=90262 RepID=A0A1X2IXA3_9FUNG|nr:hypothetical protein BCR42DRAFT_403984 [Absidia repens]
MTPVHRLPYDLSSLTWNATKTRNDQKVYCYCGKDYSEHKTMIRCGSCEQLFHHECTKKVTKALLYGDMYYDFQCSACTQGEEKYTRNTLKWKEVVELALYHLTMQRRFSKGKQLDKFYFRFSTEICDCIENNWNVLLSDRAHSTTWRNTVASSLSTHPELFLSGTLKMEEYGKGWWALKSEDPPQKQTDRPERQVIAKAEVTKKLKRPQAAVDGHGDQKPTMVKKGQSRDMLVSKRRRGSSPAEELQAIKTEADTEGKYNSNIKNEVEPMLENKKDVRENGDLEMRFDAPAKKSCHDERPKKAKNMLSKSEPPSLVLMSQQDEWQTYQTLEHAEKKLSIEGARFRRKLALRRLKRNVNLKLFDIDQYVAQHLRSTKNNMMPIKKLAPSSKTTLTAQQQTLLSPSTRTAMKAMESLKSTRYDQSFASRIYGRPRHAYTLTSDDCWLSAWNGRKLRPFIRRDYENKPIRVQLLEQIKTAHGRPLTRQRQQQKPITDICTMEEEKETTIGNKTSIDYVYFQREHLDQVNRLLARCFWDGVDVSESLQFPEFSVIALYKRCVIGCAFMTPEAYITYFAVMAGWERAGIGQFMLYHLFQTAISKDITLHVSANNNAMILYQKFGFKPEEFIVNFYDKYLPAESSFSKNAFFLRLRR